MNPILTNASQLKQIIEQEVQVMQSLSLLLSEEQQVLVNNESEKLELITPNKNQLLTQIVELEKSRSHAMNQLGLPNDAKGMQALFSGDADAKALQSLWQTLIQISSTAQEQNKTNGLLINRQINKNQATLSILQSGNNHQAGSMYGADGQSKIKASAARGIVAG
ncbi:flagella synthesis protein FlgN [Undibacterium fentianense]|uniref:Flagellar protein FlgN n=1 Tax=Undibacterium fentianense TaxID=2828728 RepID=A0A941E0P1_9BURK|nr:flagellar protein FlgN [Undibacterium fentianense]MBR7798791.1 flagellar protein FlgN [Undibacterium fentianense]